MRVRVAGSTWPGPLGTAATAALIAVAACAGPDVPAGVGMSAPDVTTVTLRGDTVHLSEFAGEPVLLNLWATWCVPCRTETPVLEALHRAHGDRGLRVIGLALDRAGFDAEVERFVAETGMTYTVLRDPEMTALDRFAAAGLPATFLIDRDGTVRHVVAGPIRADDRRLEAALSELLP